MRDNKFFIYNLSATMFVKLSKKTITKYLLPHLHICHLGRKTKKPIWRYVKAIIYKLKTGCQWREIPIIEFFGVFNRPKFGTIWYHFDKWSKDGSWKNLWTELLRLNRAHLDMSITSLDGSHSPAKRGHAAVGYQGRKKCKTTNLLFITDKKGMPLAVSDPISGNHNDLYEIEKHFKKMLADIRAAGINTNGLFLNADAGFDSQGLRELSQAEGIHPNFDENKRNGKDPDRDYMLDELMYKFRFSVEQVNAWIDAYKNVLLRYTIKPQNWKSWHYLAFSLILLRKTHI